MTLPTVTTQKSEGMYEVHPVIESLPRTRFSGCAIVFQCPGPFSQNMIVESQIMKHHSIVISCPG